jgi:acetyl-CoA carboxylase biotin carboxylase subunit
MTTGIDIVQQQLRVARGERLAFTQADVRCEGHAIECRVPPYYDSMIAKLIVQGSTREDALDRMRLALAEMHVEGIATNVPLHREILRDAGFAAGGVDIHHLERWLAQRSAA